MFFNQRQLSADAPQNTRAPRERHREWVFLLGVLLLFVLLLILGLAVQSNFARLKEANRWNIHTYQVLERLGRISNLLDAHEAQLSGFALDGDTQYLKQLKQSNGVGMRALADLRALTRDRPSQTRRLMVIEPQFLAYKARFVLPYMRDDLRAQEAVSIQRTLRAQTVARSRETSQLKARLRAMEITEREFIQLRARALVEAQSKTSRTLILCSVFVAALALSLMFLLVRAVRAQQQASDDLRDLNQSLSAEVAERRTIESSLRASEIGFRHLAEDSLDMICRHAPDGTLTYVSPASRPLLGYAPDELVGLHPSRFIFDSDAREHMVKTAESFAHQMSDTHDKPLLRAYRHADGQRVWLEIVGHSIMDSDNGQVRAWHTTARDVSSRVREEKERARLLSGLRAVVEIADDLIATTGEDELLQRAVEMMCARVGLKRCSIYLSVPGETEGEFSSLMRGTFGSDENGRAVPENDLFYDTKNEPDTNDVTPTPGERWIVRNNQVRYIWRDGMRIETPQRGWIARTPISTRDNVIGLFFHDSALANAAHDAVDQQLIAVFCSLLGALIERGRSQTRMNRQQLLLQSVMENAPLFLYSVDKNEKFTLATGQVLPAIGLDANRMLGRPMTEFAPPESSSVLAMRRALNGETVQEEMMFGGRWLKMWRQPLHDDDGSVSGMLGIGMDITQQHSAQVALRESEARYRQVADSLQDVLFQIDARGCWDFLNPAWTEITGYAVAESLGTPCEKVLHPDDLSKIEVLSDYILSFAQRAQENSLKTPTTGEAQQGVLRFITRQNQVRWIQFTLRSSFDEHGIFAGATGTLSDVTEKTRAENALRETLEMKRAILQGASYAIISTDEHGVIKTFNPAAETLFGVTSDEVVEKVALTAFHDAAELETRARDLSDEWNETLAPGFETLVARARRDGADEAQWNCVRADGTAFPMRISHSVLRDSGGAIAGYVSIGYDLTEAQRSEKLKNEFVSVVSHELRTPLTSIRGALGLLSGGVAGALPASASQMIGIAQKNADRLVLLINDILDIEKIESGKMRFDMSEISLANLLENALESNRGYAQTLGVSIELEPLAPALQNATIAGDEPRLQQVMSNLISNACKWTPTGTVVKIRALMTPDSTPENPRVSIEVQDAGPGVPPEFESRLFERFSQADGSATREKGGTGLGLSVTLAIIKKHGGSIGYRAPDLAANRVGATFCVELSTKHVAVTPAPPTRGRMLVVEDDEEIAAVLRAVLEDAGYAVDVANSRAQALQIARSGAQFDGATLDLHLPDGHGSQLLEELRALPQTRALPVAVITSFCENQNEYPMKTAVEHWFAKPFAPAQLLSAIASWNLPETAAVASHKTPNNGEKARVLHVEDDEDIHRVVAMILDESSDLIIASTLAQARQKLRDEQFDLVLIDIGLPDGSGLDLVEQIQNQRLAVPIVIFSAREEEAEAASNVAAALIKSRTPNEALRSQVEALLGHKSGQAIG